MKVRILKSICHPVTGKPLGKGGIFDIPKEYATSYINGGIAEPLRGAPKSAETALSKKEPVKRRRRTKKTD